MSLKKKAGNEEKQEMQEMKKNSCLSMGILSLPGEIITSDAQMISLLGQKSEELKSLLMRVAEFIFLGSKITVDGDCSHEIKRRLFVGRKSLTNLASILKSRDVTLQQSFI